MKKHFNISLIIFITSFTFSCTKSELRGVELENSPFSENSGVDLITVDTGWIEGTGIFAIGYINGYFHWDAFDSGDTIDEFRVYRDGVKIQTKFSIVVGDQSSWEIQDLGVTQGPYFSYSFCFYSKRWGESKKTPFGMSS